MTPPPFKILGIGEILWDLLPSGRQLGGAPANFVCHAQALGAQARLISRVGDDDLGREILARWRALGLPTETIVIDPQAPTGTVSVELAADGQPRFTIHENVAWDRLTADATALAAAAEADAVCFGTLAQRSVAGRRAIGELLAATRSSALRIFDVNLRPPFVDRAVIAESLAEANVLKLNETELPILAAMFSIDDQLATLADRFELRLVALTRGSAGSLLYADGQSSDHAGLPVQVRDAVGAGDAFTAAVTLGFLRHWDLETINQRANEVAAFVCSQAGATPPLPDEIRRPFGAWPHDARAKIATWRNEHSSK